MEDTPDRVIFVSHCILNQSTRARWQGGGARRDAGACREVLDLLMAEGVGVVQMGCPEFSLFGNPRPPRTKEGYDTPEFREACDEIAGRACDMMDAFREAGPEAVEVVAVLGLEGSPSCGVGRTPRISDGEEVEASEPGLFMEALMEEMRVRGIEAPYLGVSLRGGEREGVLTALRALLAAEERWKINPLSGSGSSSSVS